MILFVDIGHSNTDSILGRLNCAARRQIYGFFVNKYAGEKVFVEKQPLSLYNKKRAMAILYLSHEKRLEQGKDMGETTV